MENAVKALLIAAGVILGVLIISLGLSLYGSLKDYVGNVEENIEIKKIQEFNEKFFKYINCENIDEETQFPLTIQDVVTAANTAYENNMKYELDEYKIHSLYVKVILEDVSDNFEKDVTSKMAELLQENLGEEYKCSSQDVKIDEYTGRVYEITFHKK